jgi:hypothetical protein
MKLRTVYIFLVIASLFFGDKAAAQQKDFVTMPQLAISHKFNASVYGEAFQQFMFSDNSRELWMSSTDFGVGYRLNKFVSTELHYRNVSVRRLNNLFENRNLFYHTITYQNSSGKYLWTIRNRLQQLSFAEHFDDGYKAPRWYNRLRFNLAKRVDYYWSGGINAEFFYPLNNNERRGLDQLRLGASVTRRFNEDFSIAVSYQLQQQLKRAGNNSYFVLGLQLNYEI